MSKRFNETTPATVISIERIQNQLLWKAYSYEKNKLKEKLGKDPTELQLFHGTRTTKPIEIYNSEDGFDMRFCQSGSWGIGSYFAHNSRFSFFRFFFLSNDIAFLLIFISFTLIVTHTDMLFPTPKANKCFL